MLNLKQIETPRSLRWIQDRVTNFRRHHHIQGPRARLADTLTQNEVQKHLGIGHNGVLGLVRAGAITTIQITDFAPWRVDREQLGSDEVRRLVGILKRTGRLPRGGSPKSQPELFDVE